MKYTFFSGQHTHSINNNCTAQFELFKIISKVHPDCIMFILFTAIFHAQLEFLFACSEETGLNLLVFLQKLGQIKRILILKHLPHLTKKSNPPQNLIFQSLLKFYKTTKTGGYLSKQIHLNSQEVNSRGRAQIIDLKGAN